ncbi:hypothetical protein FKM82_003648 [Ascaphus truei]
MVFAEDFECIPGFQQKLFYIEQPSEFTEDQLVLNGREITLDFVIFLQMGDYRAEVFLEFCIWLHSSPI